MKRLLLSLGMLLGIALGAFHPQTAYAADAVTCTDYRTLNPSAPTLYPNNGYMYVCYTATETKTWWTANRVSAILTAAGQSGNADKGLIMNYPNNYFYFNTGF
jgi:hypothetical protein